MPSVSSRKTKAPGSRARSGMTASIEDYLEGIYDLTGSGGPVIGARLARHLKVSPPAVTEALQRMTRDGYLRIGPG